MDKLGASVFDAASSPIRMQILKLLSTRGSLSYTEIMSTLKLDPVRDAGKFVYHLKSVMEPGLVSVEKETRKYAITELGRMVVGFARDIEEYVAVKRGRLFVRSSRLAIEEFDRVKITKSLVTEAGMPHELAAEVAAEAEERLIKLKVAYLTAPLIREFVNAILIEKHLEEYRHKLTRLGMPVYDVTQSLRIASEQLLDANSVQGTAASAVIGEYVLLNGIPRGIADAHLSGTIHLDNAATWILKPSELQHDIRNYLRHGLPGVPAPSSLLAALSLLEILYDLSAVEVSGEQGFDMFNVFLAPFVQGVDREKVKEILENFVARIRDDFFSARVKPGLSLGLELDVPNFIADLEAVGKNGQLRGKYGDYSQEARTILECLVEIFAKFHASKPVLTPRLIFKIRPTQADQSTYQALLLRLHDLAISFGIPYFALLDDSEKTVYSATGSRLGNEWKESWEKNCYQTGVMDTIFINLPRISYESTRNDSRFLSNQRDIFNLCVEAFKAKRDAMRKRLQQGLLPLLSGGVANRTVFLDENAAYDVSFVGLYEAVVAHTGSSFFKSAEAMKFAHSIVDDLREMCSEASSELGIRILPAQRPGDEPSERLAKLDVEKYGVSVAAVGGTKSHPYYKDMPILRLDTKATLEERVEVEAQFQKKLLGGHFLQIPLSNSVHTPEALLKATLQTCWKAVSFYAYSRNFSSCMRCGTTTIGLFSRCSVCGSDRVVQIGRSSSTLLPMTLWPETKRRAVEKRVAYSFQ